MAREMTPYDTGARLEPVPWVGSDGRVARENRRPAQPDDYGKIDFNDGKVDLTDDGGDTIAIVYAERTPEGKHVLYLEEWGHEVEVIRL